MRALYEIADQNHTTVEELTGTRRRYSTVELPEPLARTFGLSEEERTITIEHHDEGMSAAQIPYILSLWELKSEESNRS